MIKRQNIARISVPYLLLYLYISTYRFHFVITQTLRSKAAKPLKKIRLLERLYYVTRPRFNDYYLNIVQTFFIAREQRARHVARQPFVQRLNNKLKLGKNVIYI